MDLLTQPETAEATRLSGRTLERRRLDGTGPKFVRLGRRIFYRRLDVEAWIAQCTRSSTSEAYAASANPEPTRASPNKKPSGTGLDDEMTRHPHPPVPGKAPPVESEPYQTRNKMAEFSSAHDEGQSGSPDQDGDPGSIPARSSTHSP